MKTKFYFLVLLLIWLLSVNIIFTQTKHGSLTAKEFFDIAMKEINVKTKSIKFMQFTTMLSQAGINKNGKSENWMMDVYSMEKNLIYRALLWNGIFYIQELPASGEISNFPITKEMLDSPRIYQLTYEALGKDFMASIKSIYLDLMKKGPNGEWQWWIIATNDKNKKYVYIDPVTYKVLGTSD